MITVMRYIFVSYLIFIEIILSYSLFQYLTIYNADPPIWITSHPHSFGGRSTSGSDQPIRSPTPKEMIRSHYLKRVREREKERGRERERVIRLCKNCTMSITTPALSEFRINSVPGDIPLQSQSSLGRVAKLKIFEITIFKCCTCIGMF
eukprot:sb/3473637/